MPELSSLHFLEENYVGLQDSLSDPLVYSDPEMFAKKSRELKKITPLYEQYCLCLQLEKEKKEARLLMEESDDPELQILAKEQFFFAETELETAMEKLQILLLPEDPDDDKNIIVEIRGGTGGEEAALFAAALYRMYGMYADKCGLKTELLESNETELGGYKVISFLVSGERAFGRLKYEGGVHRVQRVPETENQGRIHTSAVTVAVLPEAAEVEVAIDPSDLQIDTFRSGGAGGQHINKTDSAVRITHLPTGTVVECQDERSQHKNKEKALKVLRARLLAAEKEAQSKELAENRRIQVGSGDRSERIRTYNFPQNRLTDHRIGLTLYKLESVMNGELEELLSALATAERTARLKEQNLSK